jgi:hypothetical protein
MSRQCRMSLVSGLAVLALCVPWTAGAASLERGTVELTPSVTLSHKSVSFDGPAPWIGPVNQSVSLEGEQLGSQTDLLMSFDFGYCTSNVVEPTGGLLVLYTSIHPEGASSTSASAFGASAGLTFNISTQGALIPFLRGTVGFLTYSGDGFQGTDTEYLAPAVSAGVRTMVGGSASLNFSALFTHHSNVQGQKYLTANEFGLAVGLSIFPRR